MVESYKVFPGSINGYEYEAKDESFWSGHILTSKGGIKFYSDKIVRLPFGTQLSFLCRISDVPGYKVEVIGVYHLITEPLHIKLIKSLLPSMGEFYPSVTKQAIDTILASEYASLKDLLTREIFSKWAIENSLPIIDLNDYLMHHHYDHFINDWFVNEKQILDAISVCGNNQYDGVQFSNFFIGNESQQQITYLLKPEDIEFEIDHDPSCRHNTDLVQSIAECASFAFGQSSIHFIPVNNQGQRVYLDYLESMGVNVYEINELESVYDLEKPCIIYGKSSKRRLLEDFLSSIQVCPVEHITPLSISLYGMLPSFPTNLNASVSRFEVEASSIDGYADRIQNLFSKKEPKNRTKVLTLEKPERVYRGIVIGDEDEVIRLSGYCDYGLIWLKPI